MKLNARGLAIAEPYASLIRLGYKHFETRAESIKYRGKVVICTTRETWDIPEMFRAIDLGMTHRMAVLVADLTDCILITQEFIDSLSSEERASGFYTVGRYAWKLENIRELNPFRVRCYPALWRMEVEA